MIPQNLGKLDRILRFTLAFWWLGPWMPQYSLAWISWGIAIIGWISLVESFLGWCLVHQIMGINNKNQ